MKTKHSGGEWKSVFRLNNERGVRNSGGYICFIPKPTRYTGQDERYERELDEVKANAKLIAVAPELLEVLNKLMEVYEKDGQLLNFNVDLARQVIKKVTE